MKVIAQRAFGEHEIVIFAGYATKFDTAPFTVRVEGDGQTWRVNCSNEERARSVANAVWRQLRAGQRDVRAICQDAAAGSPVRSGRPG